MKSKPNPFNSRPSRAIVTAIASMLLSLAVHTTYAQTTGFLQTGAGPFDYNNSANWAGGAINGIWDSSLNVTTGQIVEFSTSTVLSTGLTFRENSAQNKTLRATGGAATLTLGGDILLNPAGNVAYSIGSTSGSQNLHVDLGGAVRTITAFGGGNGGNFAKTLTFHNNVSNGGIIASGGGSGGGKIQFNALSISLTSATVRDAELSFNGSNNNSANSVYTISGALTGGGGASTVTVVPKTSATARNALVSAGSFARNAGSTILFRGTGLGTTTIASATSGVTNISFGTAPTLSGVGGGSGTTIGIIAGAFGDTNSTGTGFGATGGLVTYDSANGVRLLTGSEYKSSITDRQTQLDNVRILNSSGGIATTTLTNATTTINSLSLGVSGATGNQGITITGGAGTTLKLNSGVIYAEQNVTGTNSATTDAMTISVPTLNLNGQEGIILATTRLNTGGTVTSNGALIINSAITNGTGLTIGDNFATNAGGYVVLGGASANTHAGNTTINGAIVQLNKSTTNTFGNIVLNLGSVYNTGNQIADTANVTINGGAFFLNGSNNSGSATNETLNNLTLTGGSVNPGSGSGNTFNVNGNASLSGGTVNMAQNAKLNIAGTTGLSGGVISVGANNSATIYNSKTTLADSVSITNTAVGTAGYTPITIAAGAAAGNLGGQVALTGDLTFTGNTNTNTVTIAAPAGTGLQGVVALNGTRTFDIGNGSAAVDLTINAPLIDGSSTGGLTKTGAGTLVLSGINTYTGPTNVNNGMLVITGNSLTATGNVTVAAGATIGGGGTLGGATTLNGILAPGNSIGVLTVNNDVTWNGAMTAGSTTDWLFELGLFNAADLLDITGAGSDFLKGSGAQFRFDFLGGTETGTYKLVDWTNTTNFLFTDFSYTNLGGGNTGTFSITGSQLNFTVVPEPNAAALIGGFGAIILLRRRRHP